MSEADYNDLLDAFRAEIEADVKHDLRSEEMFFAPIPSAANDNHNGAWPLVPFPEGWHGAC